MDKTIYPQIIGGGVSTDANPRISEELFVEKAFRSENEAVMRLGSMFEAGRTGAKSPTGSTSSAGVFSSLSFGNSDWQGGSDRSISLQSMSNSSASSHRNVVASGVRSATHGHGLGQYSVQRTRSTNTSSSVSGSERPVIRPDPLPKNGKYSLQKPMPHGCDLRLLRKSKRYLCCFWIDVDPREEFGVVKKILGRHGGNMRSISQEFGAKIRLRGRGSGYLEGVERRESPEQLQLHLSCTNATLYQEGKDALSVLLHGLYSCYTMWRVSRGLPERPEPKVRVEEYRHDDRGGNLNAGILDVDMGEVFRRLSDQTKQWSGMASGMNGCHRGAGGISGNSIESQSATRNSSSTNSSGPSVLCAPRSDHSLKNNDVIVGANAVGGGSAGSVNGGGRSSSSGAGSFSTVISSGAVAAENATAVDEAGATPVMKSKAMLMRDAMNSDLARSVRSLQNRKAPGEPPLWTAD
jgi:hypothetical protein